MSILLDNIVDFWFNEATFVDLSLFRLTVEQNGKMNKSTRDVIMDDEKVLTTEQACHFLNISRQTLYKLVKSKKVHGKRVGENYRFLRSELLSYLKSDE